MFIPGSSTARPRLQHALRKVGPAALTAIAMAMASASSTAGPPITARIVPPDGTYQGLTYGEWQAREYQWTYGVPTADNPVLLGNEAKLANGQPRHLWFLSGTLPVEERHFLIPAGTALWVTIFAVEWDNYLCVEPDTSFTVAQLREIAKDAVDTLTDIVVTIDGVTVPNVLAYRSTTPVFDLTLPQDNIVRDVFGCDDARAGTYPGAIGDGRALILKPLPVGEHTIHTTALGVPVPADPTQDVPVDLTLHLTVVPHADLPDADGGDE